MDIWQILMTPFSWILRQFILLFDSYGVALILFTIVVKVILFPFSLKSKKGMIQMNILSGQQAEIQKRYPNDRNKQQEELQKLYAKNNVNPMGGCLWSLIPMFVLFPLYAIIRRPFKYLMGLTDEATTAVANALNWTTEMGREFSTAGVDELTMASWLSEGNNLATASAAAGSDSLFVIPFDFFGIDLSQIPNWQFWADGITWGAVGLFLLPVISAALSFVSSMVMQKTNAMNRQQEQTQQSAQMRSMMITMPLMSLWIGFTMPAGLCVYWISNSLFSMVQELIAGRMLRKDYEEAQRKIAEQAERSKAEEKERRRLAAEKKAAALAEKKSGKKKSGGQSKKEPSAPAIDREASRVGMRPYARGRAYDPNRYPVTPYPYDSDGKPIPDSVPEPELEPLTEEEKELLADKPSLVEAAEAAAPDGAEEAGQAGSDDDEMKE